MRLSVAGLRLEIEEGKHQLSTDSLPCHFKFVSPTGEPESNSVLRLRFADAPDYDTHQLLTPICRNEIWELWLDPAGKYVFTQPGQVPQRWIVIAPDFTTGFIYGDFSALAHSSFYPLEYLDIVIYSNWLALRGDLILHASGIAWQDKAFVFIGHSGAGKSTLVSDLSALPKVTVLGEDQLVLRKIDQKFFVYGTPWHENPDRCDPRGVPLSKIFFLDRGAKQTLTPLSGFDASVRIMTTAFVPYYFPERVQAIMDTLSKLPTQTRAFVLAYQRGSDILETLKRA